MPFFLFGILLIHSHSALNFLSYWYGSSTIDGISTRLAKERLMPTRILMIKSKFVLPGLINPPDAPRVASLALYSSITIPLSIIFLGFIEVGFWPSSSTTDFVILE